MRGSAPDWIRTSDRRIRNPKAKSINPYKNRGLRFQKPLRGLLRGLKSKELSRSYTPLCTSNLVLNSSFCPDKASSLSCSSSSLTLV